MPSATRRAAQVSNASRLDAVEAALARIAEPDIAKALIDLGIEPRPSIAAAARLRAAEEAARAADTARFAAAATEHAAAETRRNAAANANSDAIYRMTRAGIPNAAVSHPPMSAAEIERYAQAAFGGDSAAARAQRQLLITRMTRNEAEVGRGGRRHTLY